MDNIKVSILVPAFNVECYIDDCLLSLMVQTLEEIEIVVVDDGSTDKTRAIAEQYAVSDNRVRVYHQEHQGVAEARNKCLSFAQGEYIGFVDSDDYVSANAFEQLYLRAKSYSADIVLGSIMYCYEDGTTDRVGDKTIVFQSGAMTGKQCFKALIDTESYIPMVCGNLYRTAFIHEYQLHFEAIFHEDEYFTPYALYYAQQVINFEEDFYYYRQQSDSIMHSKSHLTKRAESLFFICSKLKLFTNKEIINKKCNEIEQTFLRQITSLYERAQNLYEKELSISSKKCLFIISEYSTAAQYGVGTYIQLLVQCFDLSTWTVNIIVLHSRSKKVQWKIKDGIAYYEIPVAGKIQYNTSLDEEQYYRSVFYYLVSRFPFPKEIYCHFNFAFHYNLALLFKKKTQARIVFTLHYTDWSFDLLGDKTWLKQILENPIGNKDNYVRKNFIREKTFMMECCDRIITIAQHSYDIAHQLYEIPLSMLAYVPNGLQNSFMKQSAEKHQTLRNKYGFSENEKIIIFAGRLDIIKGVVELIKTFKQVLEVIPEARLIIAGTGNFDQCMEAAFPNWKYITFTGFISHEQLYELYTIADIGVVPSIHEEFGYVAAEMMMYALPILVNNTTGLKELVTDARYGNIFNYGDNNNTEELKKQIITMLTANSKPNILARERILKYFSFQLFRLRIQEIYN